MGLSSNNLRIWIMYSAAWLLSHWHFEPFRPNYRTKMFFSLIHSQVMKNSNLCRIKKHQMSTRHLSLPLFVATLLFGCANSQPTIIDSLTFEPSIRTEYCPIVDFEHADMAYEWLYSCTNNGIRAQSLKQSKVSEELKAQFPDYLNSLSLKKTDGTPLTIENHTKYIKSYLIASAQKAIDEGYPMPETCGIVRRGQCITDIDLPTTRVM